MEGTPSSVRHPYLKCFTEEKKGQLSIPSFYCKTQLFALAVCLYLLGSRRR